MIAEPKEETLLEKIMRFSPPVIALSLTFAMISSAGVTKRADHDIDPLSVSLVTDGEAAAKQSEWQKAIDLYETALAVDPRNRAAFVGMARAAKAQGLNGKAIRFYKSALEIEPNDQVALGEQAQAMIDKGAAKSARTNIARLRLLCQANCSGVDALDLAANKATDKPQLQASAVTIKPVATEAPAKKN